MLEADALEGVPGPAAEGGGLRPRLPVLGAALGEDTAGRPFDPAEVEPHELVDQPVGGVLLAPAVGGITSGTLGTACEPPVAWCGNYQSIKVDRGHWPERKPSKGYQKRYFSDELVAGTELVYISLSSA